MTIPRKMMTVIGEDDEDMEEDNRPFEDLRLQLKHSCREAIRNHLLELDPYWNLFDRIHLLPLPSRMREYLVFDVSLEPEDDNLNNMDDETLMMVLKSMQIPDDDDDEKKAD